MSESTNSLSGERGARLLEAWKTSEDIAMHFNNLLLGFRLKAIGGIAVAAVLAVGLKVGELADPGIIVAVFVSLAIIWLLVWAADFFYYYRLLAGAVDELLRLGNMLGQIRLSHLIERRVQGTRRPAGTRVPFSRTAQGTLPNVPPGQYGFSMPCRPSYLFCSLPACGGDSVPEEREPLVALNADLGSDPPPARQSAVGDQAGVILWRLS